MVAYSFKKRFIVPIKLGLGQSYALDDVEGDIETASRPKRQTIRAIGKRRHARVGENVQLYYGMRTKQCRPLGIGRCTDVSDIKITFKGTGGKVEIDGSMDIVTREIRTREGLDEFARADGFKDWAEMQQFWRQEHRGKRLGPFVGVMIEWEPLI